MTSLLRSVRAPVLDFFSRCVLKCRLNYNRSAAVCAALLMMMFGTWQAGLGQAFDGYQSPQSVVASTGLSSPYQLAVDPLGNVYIADAGNNRILKETPSGNVYTQSVVPSSSLNGPLGVAVDASGNVYIADSSNGRVLKETLSGGSYTESVISSSGPHRRPQCLAVDRQGNVYVADPGYSALFKETPSGSSYTETIIPVQYDFTGSANEVAVDQEGNLYVTTGGAANGPVSIKLVPSGNTYTVSAVLASYQATALTVDNAGNVFLGGYRPGVQEVSPYGQLYLGITVDESPFYPSGLAADSSGNLYVADYQNNRVVKDKIWNGDFGSVDIGTAAPTLSLIFRSASLPPASIGTPVVVTQGVTGLDFTDAGTGTCTTNGPYNIYSGFETCTVDLIFNPKAIGSRFGAVNLKDSSGNVVASGYVRGVAEGPQLSFLPGSQSKLGFGNVTNPNAIAADAAGNLYVAQAIASGNPGNSVVKESWNGTGYIQTTVATGLVYPVGVAVDGAGNVFIADRDASAIVEAQPSNGTYATHTQFASAGSVQGVAVDGLGNVYFASSSLGAVKETYQGTGWGYGESTIAAGGFVAGIAVDGQGNVYLSDNVSNQVLLEKLVSGNYVQQTLVSGLSSPHGIAVDGAGGVYIADTASGTVLKETLSGGSYEQSTLASGISVPLDVAVDGFGRVYYSSTIAKGVWQLDYSSAPALQFAASYLGQTSADSPQVVTIANAGNAPLIFPVLPTENNPNISANFNLDSSAASACPLVGPNSPSTGTLAAGASCQFPVSFTPLALGKLSGSLVLTDNDLNAMPPGYTSQSIALSGTGLAVPSFTIGAAPASLAVTQGAHGISTITVTPLNGFNDSVGLVASGLPSGVSVVFATNPTTQSSLVTLTASATATFGSATVTITGTSGSLTSSTTIALTVNVPPGVVLSASPSSLRVTRGKSGTSSITVTPNGGFTGSVALTAAITSSPSGAQDLPTLSFGSSSPVSITGVSAETATLAITTQPATSAAMTRPKLPGGSLYLAGNLALGCLLLFGVPKRRRSWRIMLGMGMSLMGLAGGLIACGGGGTVGGGSGNPGTTSGTYVVTVTGSSGSATDTCTVTLIVQ